MEVVRSNFVENQQNKIVYPDLSYQIMGALFEVHRELGNRYQEKYYQRATCLAFDKRNINYQRELIINLIFHDKIIGKYILDFLVENKIIVELKTVNHFSYNDVRQVLAYLKAKKLLLGILVNFRSHSLTYKRIINPDIEIL